MIRSWGLLGSEEAWKIPLAISFVTDLQTHLMPSAILTGCVSSLSGVWWSQAHRTAEFGRGLWKSSAPTPAPAGTPKAGCPGPCPGDFWRSPRWETTGSLWAACASTQSSTQLHKAAFTALLDGVFECPGVPYRCEEVYSAKCCLHDFECGTSLRHKKVTLHGVGVWQTNLRKI